MSATTLARKLSMSFPFICCAVYLFCTFTSMAEAMQLPTPNRIHTPMSVLNTKTNSQPSIQAAIATLMLSVVIALPDTASAKPGDIAPTDKDNQLVQVSNNNWYVKFINEYQILIDQTLTCI